MIALRVLLAVFCVSWAAAADELPAIRANDNSRPAGARRGDVVTLRLEIRDGRWFPDDENGQSLPVYAFAEEGAAPRIPGPLLRVTEGTTLDVTITNRLAKRVYVRGLHGRPGDAKQVIDIAPGATQGSRFLAGTPGTYFYWASTTNGEIDDTLPEDTQLVGGFVIDPRGGSPADRIFVITLGGRCTADLSDCFEVQAINGKSWPYSERFTFDQGEPVRWRWINASVSEHAMHLHGLYYTVEKIWDMEREQPVAAGERNGVTHHFKLGESFQMSFTPHTAGNWLFHCHMTAHMMPHPTLDSDPKHPHEHHFANDAGMGGLVLGISVRPRPAVTAAAATSAKPRQLRLLVRPRPLTARGRSGFSYELASEKETPEAELPQVGAPLVLTRGEPVAITIENRTSQPTAVHWHGIELESYYDGVPGWTGEGKQITPPIPPGGSFVARFTPPRAGTFLYHTHWHDVEQITGGLAGPLLVMDPGETYDSQTDRSFIFTRAGEDELKDPFLLNGSTQPPAQTLRVGTKYRLRLLNITPDNVGLVVELTALSNRQPVRWVRLAKDGATLAKEEQALVEARQPITVGETYDFEFTPSEPGILLLQGELPGNGLVVTQVIKVSSAQAQPTPPQ